ncbi:MULTISPECIES: class I SAM-dependent methyltransferase [unclassified Arenibacter]|uniref:class I SAM-dependent methyltransferase n=1 Tax=unclassified Arenibacter TaxID=2615047 RepID=UPI000E351473|nr:MULTISPECIES: class I SAM-dependent methyltransferase [unclassified Arenibacter]MCM4166017.1 SAM-dependent methyltransferase [Arenibacter sp. A80]RFT54336.1 methyltransferase domain-containing protein [Arenibacter sp. P308M17]
MKKIIQTSFLFVLLLTWCQGMTQSSASNPNYTYKKGNPNGIGKWYLGREIAHVMGYQGMQWLDRPEREEEENTTTLLLNMAIEPEDKIADIGAGSGYHVFKMAKLARHGLIYAVDIQDEMLQEINNRKDRDQIKNVRVIKGGEKNINIPENSLNKVLMVDVYHEFNYPAEMLVSIKKALKADGELFLIEYRGEDGSVPIKPIHKMTEAQAIREMQEAGMKLHRNIENLPWQHCMVFIKD